MTASNPTRDNETLAGAPRLPINLRNLPCKLEIDHIDVTDGCRVVHYVVPDNTLGIAKISLVTLFEVDPPSDPYNPTYVSVLSDNEVAKELSDMTGWQLEYSGTVCGYDNYVPSGWEPMQPIEECWHYSTLTAAGFSFVSTELANHARSDKFNHPCGASVVCITTVSGAIWHANDGAYGVHTELAAWAAHYTN